MKPYVFSSSEVDGNGYQSITVCLKEPDVNENGLYQFGRLVLFSLNHVRQETTAYQMSFSNGGANIDPKVLKKWNGEILCEKECLEIAKVMF